MRPAPASSGRRAGSARWRDETEEEALAEARPALPRGVRPRDLQGGPPLVGRRRRGDDEADLRGARRRAHRGRGRRRAGLRAHRGPRRDRNRRGRGRARSSWSAASTRSSSAPACASSCSRAAHLKRVSRTAGWISPVVLGRRSWRRASGTRRARANGWRSRSRPSARSRPRQRTAIGAAADRVAAVQGASADVRYGPVFAGAAPLLAE